MQRIVSFVWVSRKLRPSSFTLIELMTTVAIISILAALTLYAGSAIMNKGMRSRAGTEISGMANALENYKVDNGAYPADTNLLVPYTPVVAATYQTASATLFFALSGQTNYASSVTTSNRAYMSFKSNQVGNPSATKSYVKDPWGNSYGYSTGNGTTVPYSGNNFFDIWSTGGSTSTTSTNSWLSNWN